MSTLDFVFGGSPAPNTAATGGTKNVPPWLSDSGMKIANTANALYFGPGNDYQPYDGPRNAAPSDATKASWDTVNNTAGKYQPMVTGALDQANKGYTDATGAVKGGMGSFTGDNVSKYMNPYLDNVTNRSAQLAMRNWNENMLPGMNSMFVGSGQPLSSGNAAVAYRGARDVTQNIQDDANATYAQGFDTAGSNFRADQNRQLTGGMDLAGIATDRAHTGIDAATTAQNMGYKDAGALDAAGQEKTGFDQKALDTRYNDFVAQRDYQKNQLNQYGQTLGLVGPTSTSANFTAPPGDYTENASPFATATSGMAGIKGLYGSRGGLARAEDAKPTRDLPAWLKSAMMELLDKHAATA